MKNTRPPRRAETVVATSTSADSTSGPVSSRSKRRPTHAWARGHRPGPATTRREMSVTRSTTRGFSCGDDGNRTHDLLLAKLKVGHIGACRSVPDSAVLLCSSRGDVRTARHEADSAAVPGARRIDTFLIHRQPSDLPVARHNDGRDNALQRDPQRRGRWRPAPSSSPTCGDDTGIVVRNYEWVEVHRAAVAGCTAEGLHNSART